MRTYAFFLPFLYLFVPFDKKNSTSTIGIESSLVKQYTIEQFYKSIRVGGGAFSSDDKKLTYFSNETGINNAYEVDLSSGKNKALTHSTKESIYVDDYVPGTKNIIYHSDKGGNENDHLFLLRQNGDLKELT